VSQGHLRIPGHFARRPDREAPEAFNAEVRNFLTSVAAG
jgi:hypothetical protein